MLPTVIRIFFAIDLPIQIKAELSKFISTLKKKSKSNQIKWTKPEQLHLTLQFVAKMQTQDLSTVISDAKNALKSCAPITISLQTLAFFPQALQAKIIFLAIKPNDTLNQMAEEIGRVLHSHGYEANKHAFTPHLTLGKVKHPANFHYLTDCKLPEPLNVEVKALTVFRSLLTKDGAIYEVIERILL